MLNQLNPSSFITVIYIMHVAALSLSFTVYHYQVKIHFTSKVDRSEMEPSITVSLYGTNGEAENLELKL